MTIEYVISWLFVMVPLVMSPGPANLVFAASGAKYGLKQSIPLLIGIDLVFVIYSIIFGFGLGLLLKNNAALYQGIQIIGVLYLLYLTYKFVKSPLIHGQPIKKASGDTAEVVEKTRYTFIDGVILQLTNPKGWAMLMTMFAVFLDGTFDQTQQIWTLVILLFFLNVVTHLLWVYMGTQLVKFLRTPTHDRWVRGLFGVLMLWVAVSLLFG